MNFSYLHKVKYHETDKMGIVHHSNYVKWLEDARIEYLKHLGIDFKDFESLGITSPVLSVKCEYKCVCEFSDEVIINCEIKEYSGVKLTFIYEVFNKTKNALSLTGETKHCFVYNNKVCALKKVNEKFDNILKEKCKKS